MNTFSRIKSFLIEQNEKIKQGKILIIGFWSFLVIILLLFFISFFKATMWDNFKEYTYQLKECGLTKTKIKELQNNDDKLYAEVLLNCFDYLERQKEEKMWIERDQNWKILFPIQIKNN